MPKVGFVSLGCPKNLVDSEVMMGTLAQAGYEITNDASEADTVVVNTCGFIESASRNLSTRSSRRQGSRKRAGPRGLSSPAVWWSAIART